MIGMMRKKTDEKRILFEEGYLIKKTDLICYAKYYPSIYLEAFTDANGEDEAIRHFRMEISYIRCKKKIREIAHAKGKL